MTSTPSADLHFRSYGQVRASDRHDFAQLVLPLSGTLLLDTLALDTPRPASRLAALMARVEAEPGQPWTTEAIAVATGLSVSRLHALFREERDTSPHAWLLDLRLARAHLAGADRIADRRAGPARRLFRAERADAGDAPCHRSDTGAVPARSATRRGRENVKLAKDGVKKPPGRFGIMPALEVFLYAIT